MVSHFDVSIIIVNYNGKKYFKDLFDSFLTLKASDISYEIIVVDNNSIDDSITYLKNNYEARIKNLKILNPGQNLGFAGGNNYGVKHANGEYIVFLNNDTRVEPDWLYNLYHGIKTSGAGIVSSKLVFFYDYLKVQVKTTDKLMLSTNITINGEPYRVDPKFCTNLLYEKDRLVCFGHTVFYIPVIDLEQGQTVVFDVIQHTENDRLVIGDVEKEVSEELGSTFIFNKNTIQTLKRTLVQNAGSGIDENYNGYDIGFCQEDQGQFSERTLINNACGAAMMMLKTDFDDVQGFDEYFFMYYEDTDLSYKIREKGKTIVYIPDSIVRHIHTGSSKEWSPFFVYHVYRNRLLFIFKHFSTQIYLKQWIKYILHVGKSVLLTSETKELKVAKAKAFIHALLQLPRYIKSKR
ncbi:glycosyltransferase family 2 protein [Paenibacillus beijingensis]|uniref:Glycosyltransferase 2-like domain-containing protein n=1 Tax=Paenibacillus beijingensis TaxID=1126833 RepID=A0A0D5NHJ5_9BACL|nr:glycosyltransferase family 2 protein [Paenibacillus beijingensis]AJY74600.1 hypothetical protein VN24_08455 [Paenibacillus beijingensis]